MKKILLTALTIGLVAAGAAVVLGSPSDDAAPSPVDRASEDISGPCDEAEHANDPRCLPGGEDREGDNGGRDHPEDDVTANDDDGDEAGEDISGPCDEAEHANDPRCTGEAPGDHADDDRVDNSGPGSMNSGPGSVNSGHDDGDDHDDSSGHGSGDSDDSSGHGSGDDD